MNGDGAGRRAVASGGPWEEAYGYARAVRVGRQVHVAGTTAARADGVTGGDDAAAQARAALDIIERALAQAGARLEHVVRTRTYVVRAADVDPVGRVHGERFAAIRPAATLVVVRALARADLLVEIEAEAILPGDDASPRRG